MANMLYNGVELPDIESVWTDKVTYPYAGISKDVDKFYGGDYLLLVSGTEFMATDLSYGETSFAVCIGYGPSLLFIYRNGAWEEYLDGHGAMYLELPFSEIDGESIGYPAATLIWTKADVIHTDGTVWFAGTEPTSAPTIDLPTVQKWMVVGSALRRLILGRGKEWEVLFEGTVETEESGDVAPYATISNMTFVQPNNTIRLTVNGHSETFVASATGSYSYIGNIWLWNDSVIDNGGDYLLVWSPFGSSAAFFTRTAGTYTIKVERMVS